MQSQIAKIITSPKIESRYFLTGSYTPREENLIQKGTIFWLIEITAPGQEKIASLIVKRFKQYYTQKEDGLWGFEAVLKKINRRLGKELQHKNSSWVNHLNAVLGLIQDNSLHLAPTGEATAYLFRENKISNILEVEESPPPLQTFISVISGDLQPNDKVFLGSSEFSSYMTIETLADFLNSPTEKALQEIANYFRERNLRKINALIVDCSEQPLHVDTIYLDQAPENNWQKTLKFIKQSKEKLFVLINQAALNIGSQELKWLKKYWQNKKNIETEKKSAFVGSALKIEAVKKISGLSSFFAQKKFREFLQKHRRNITLVAIILTLIAFASLIVWQKSGSHKKDLIAKFEQAQKLVEEAKIKKTTRQTEEAYNLLNQAESLTKEVKSYAPLSSQAEDLSKIINEELNTLTNTIRLSPLTPILSDLNSQGEVETEKLLNLNGKIITYNLKHNQFFSIDPATKKTETYFYLPQAVGSPEKATLFSSDTTYFFIQTNQQSFFLYSTKDKNLVEAPQAGSFDWPAQIKDLLNFRNRVYFFTPSGLWRSSYTASGFTSPHKALETDLNNALSAAIDGAIYLLFPQGEIKKFLAGKQTDFSLKIPFYLDLSQADKIFTQPDLGSLFILIKNQRKIVVFDKAGEFKQQIVFPEEWGEIQDFIADVSGNLFVLAQNKIYQTKY